MLPATHMNSWYPSGRRLDQMLTEAYNEAKISNGKGLIKAIIVPHAGYVYCVRTSMHAFRNLDPSAYDRVFVLGPSHHIGMSYCTIANATSAESPYGEIPFDTDVCNKLTTTYPSLFKKLDIETASEEHSMEMEFPLLKFVFKDKPFKIVPIMVGQLSFEACQSTANAISQFVKDQRTLLVISSDFCHWGARFGYSYLPNVDGQVFEKIRNLDQEGGKMISSGDPKCFKDYLDSTRNTICGRNAILIMMFIFQGKHAEFLNYSQSSQITSKNDSSVSYYSAIIRDE